MTNGAGQDDCLQIPLLKIIVVINKDGINNKVFGAALQKEIDNHDTQNLAQATELWLPLSVEASVESRGIILLGTYLTATTFIFFLLLFGHI